MEKSTVLGMNRTGVDMSPIDIKEMLAFTNVSPASSGGDESSMAAMRREYIGEAEVLGSIPPPGTLKGMASTAMQKLTGKNPEAFIDKLGCRMAFERTGVRLYDALIAKCSSSPQGNTVVPIDTLWTFRNQELQHFKLVEEVASMGLIQVLTDPRTSIAQCMEAILIAELADNDAWQMLILFAEKMGMDDMARDFGVALSEEDNHLMHIRQWYKQLVLEDAAVAS
jgi:hypothetical protein